MRHVFLSRTLPVLLITAALSLAVIIPMSKAIRNTSPALTELNDRNSSIYRPGDCVRNPVEDRTGLERWEPTPGFKTLYMIADVGEHKYRLREWGERRSSTPQWYAGYASEALPFSVLDNTKEWQPVPCPEEVASADLIEAIFAERQGSIETFTVSSAGDVKGNVVRFNTFVTQ